MGGSAATAAMTGPRGDWIISPAPQSLADQHLRQRAGSPCASAPAATTAAAHATAHAPPAALAPAEPHHGGGDAGAAMPGSAGNRLRALASLGSVALYLFYSLAMIVGPRVSPHRGAGSLRPGAWSPVSPWPPARVTETRALSDAASAADHAGAHPYRISGAWAGGRRSLAGAQRYAVARIYSRGWEPVAALLACAEGSPDAGAFLDSAMLLGSDQKSCTSPLRSPLCHCALEAYVSHAANASAEIAAAVQLGGGGDDDEDAAPRVAAAAARIEALRSSELPGELRRCAASVAPSLSTSASTWAGCAGLCPFVGLATALAASCLTSMPHLAVWGVCEGAWTRERAWWGLGAGAASCCAILGVFCASVSGARAAWLQAWLLAALLALGCAVRAASTLGGVGVGLKTPRQRRRQGSGKWWAGISTMAWLSEHDAASDASVQGPIADRFWEGYIAQLPILSVVVDTMAHRRASWLVLGGVVSSASIALLGASLSKCNELCMALALCAGAEKRGEGDASPKAMQGVVEVPPRGHADVMRVVSTVSRRSMGMAFGASVAIWGVMQGKATVRYLSDTPGLLERPTPERGWIEALHMGYTLLPLLDAPGIHLVAMALGGRATILDRELMGAVRLLVERVLHACMVWAMLQASGVFA